MEWQKGNQLGKRTALKNGKCSENGSTEANTQANGRTTSQTVVQAVDRMSQADDDGHGDFRSRRRWRKQAAKVHIYVAEHEWQPRK